MRRTWQTTDSGGGQLVLAILAVIVIAAIAGPVAAAAAELVRAVVIAVAVLGGLALAAGAALVAYRLRRGRQGAPLVARRVTPVTRQAAEPLPAPRRPAIERPAELHLHFHGLTAEDVAAILARRDGQ